MAEFAIAAAVIGTVLSVASAGAGLIASGREADAIKAAGISQKLAADSRADQLRAKAGQERAIAQRKAAEERRQGEIASSNLRAAAAASGGDTLDEGILDLEGNIAAEQEFRSLAALFTGESAARDLEFGAALEAFGGRQGLEASRIGARSTRRRGIITFLSATGQTALSAASFGQKFKVAGKPGGTTGSGSGFTKPSVA